MGLLLFTLKAVILPVLVLSRLHHRPHELLCSTGVEHEERLTQQGMLLTHQTHRGDLSFKEQGDDNKAEGDIFSCFLPAG